MSGAILLALAHPAVAATWTVEKDGSGDFTVIQDAIDAASAGDVIQIGPGMFEDVHVFDLPGGPTEAHAFSQLGSLSIVGSGEGVTIIGPTTGPGDQFDPIGFMTGANSAFFVSEISFENLSSAIQGNGPYVSVDNCSFEACHFGVDALCWVGTEVRSCTFLDTEDIGIIVFKPLGAKDVVVEDCLFRGGFTGIDLQSQNNFVNNCRFENIWAGMQFSFGATGTIQSCQFENIGDKALILSSLSTANVSDCEFGVSPANIFITNGSQLSGTGNVLGGGTVYTVYVTPSSSVSFHNSHIFNGGGNSVHISGPSNPPKTFDFRDNFWGSSDASQIEAWIHDDADGQSGSVVLYQPFHNMPVPTERTSMGGLKAKFDGSGAGN